MTVYLTKTDVLAIAEEILPTVGLRDGGQLHVAVLRPQATVFGEGTYLDLNGETLSGTDADAAEALVVSVTTGELKDTADIAERLRALEG
ncbi:hypothetical protein [Streptosporangium sp. NPDC003464]